LGDLLNLRPRIIVATCLLCVHLLLLHCQLAQPTLAAGLHAYLACGEAPLESVLNAILLPLHAYRD
jgi:hypothetical protein